MVITKKRNRYIKRSSLRKIKKYKRMYGGTRENIDSLNDLINYIKQYTDQPNIIQLLYITVETSIIINDETNFLDRQYLIDHAKKLSDIYDIKVEPLSWMGRLITDDSHIPEECLNTSPQYSQQKIKYDELKKQLMKEYDEKKQLMKEYDEKNQEYIKQQLEYDKVRFKVFHTKPIKVDKPMKPILPPLNFCNISIECIRNPNCDHITIPIKKIVDDYSKRENDAQNKDNNTFFKVKYYFESDPDKKLLKKYYIIDI
jgi:hypothetical protein